jgi:hypothetical protein
MAKELGVSREWLHRLQAHAFERLARTLDLAEAA